VISAGAVADVRISPRQVRQKDGVSFIYREEALGKGKSGRPTIVPVILRDPSSLQELLLPILKRVCIRRGIWVDGEQMGTSST
jgi:hypothetical protein